MNTHLTSFISQLPSDQLITITGATLSLRNGDVHYPFRQDSDFLYLTGLSVPGLVLTIFVGASHIQDTAHKILSLAPVQLDSSFSEESSEIILWREPITDHDMIWGTDKLSDDELRGISGIEDIRDPAGLEEYYIHHSDRGYICSKDINSSGQILRTLAGQEESEKYWRAIIHTMRMIKTPDEIQKIEYSISLTYKIYEDILAQVKPGMYEYEIEALVAYGFRRYHGTEAFPTIVASGPNSCTLHYTQHTRQLQAGDLVLLDFGIEIDGYGADISRTFTVLGDMNSRQQQIYDAVLDVQRYAASTLRPGVTRREWNEGVKEYMFGICQRLKLPNIETYTPKTNPYFPHSIGHFLGLDTHDVGDSDIPFAPGMIMTIEPGIYIREEGIGVRIEDDYLITETDCIQLGKNIEK